MPPATLCIVPNDQAVEQRLLESRFELILDDISFFLICVIARPLLSIATARGSN